MITQNTRHLSNNFWWVLLLWSFLVGCISLNFTTFTCFPFHCEILWEAWWLSKQKPLNQLNTQKLPSNLSYKLAENSALLPFDVYLHRASHFWDALHLSPRSSQTATRGQYGQQKSFAREAFLLKRPSKLVEIAHRTNMTMQTA